VDVCWRTSLSSKTPMPRLTSFPSLCNFHLLILDDLKLPIRPIEVPAVVKGRAGNASTDDTGPIVVTDEMESRPTCVQS
jgi:hypothetical protein